MEWYEAEVRALEELNGAPARPAVFYGSSSFRMWDTLAEDLRSPWVVNRAFGGSTLAACVHFFDRLIPPVTPASLIVYAGDNDLGDGRPVSEVLTSFRALRHKVEDNLGGRPFAFVSVKPSPSRSAILDRIRAANDSIREEVEKMDGGVWIDVFTPMLAAGPDLFLEDGLHLSRAGYELWIETLDPYRNQLLIER